MVTIFALVFIIVCSIFWRLGGWSKAGWSGYRDVLIPILLGVWWMVYSWQWWLFLVVAAGAQTIRIGYGSYDPEHDDHPSFLAALIKDREGCWIRLIYGVITAFFIGIGPAVYYRDWGWFALYCVFNAYLEFALNKTKANDWVTELANGAGRASVILWMG